MSEAKQGSAATERSKGSRGALGLVFVGGLAVAVAATHIVDRNNMQHEHAAPTIHDLFKQANQECANEKVAAVSVTPERIAQADSLAALTEQINSDVKSQITTCVVDETKIPVGTEGFTIVYPTLELNLNASAVAVAEGN